MRRGLGDQYLDTLFNIFDDAVPADADLVTYWFAKAHKQLVSRRAGRAGLVATNSIRGGGSREVLERVIAHAPIFDAWADESWIVDGAAVRVSLVCFGSGAADSVRLDGNVTTKINSDLTDSTFDLTRAIRLTENCDAAFQGITKGAPFEVDYEIARNWLLAPTNPNGQGNSSVLHRIWSGGDIARRGDLGWAVDFTGLSEREASFFEAPFAYVVEAVKPLGSKKRRALYRTNWWLFAEGRPGFRREISRLSRYIATPKVSRYRIFVWFEKSDLPDNLVIAIARDDDTTFGILHSQL